MRDNKDNPLLIGKLSEENGHYSLMGHMGDVCSISQKEYEIMKSMDGFMSFCDISKQNSVKIEYVKNIFKKNYGDKKLVRLSEWNKIGWCEKCKVHIIGRTCKKCYSNAQKITFSPPCDPFIGFEKEQKFILELLEERYKIDYLPPNPFFLINNGVKDNVFFWEVEYAGHIILKIEFCGFSPNEWKATLVEYPKTDNCCYSKEYINKLVEQNKEQLEIVEKNSIAMFVESSKFCNTKPLLYFSAGKESMVMLQLLKKSKIEANALTVATGVEFPDDYEFIKKMKKEIEMIPEISYFFYEGDGQSIVENLNSKRILSAKNPWCRVDFKRKLKNKGTESIYNGKMFVAFEGSRWYENDFRRRHPKVNFISDYSQQVWIHPIAEWTSFEIWLYIFKEKMSINPIYFKGFQRTTCWMCPIVNPIHFYNSRECYPELWEKISNCKLEAFGDDQSRDLPY